MIFMSPNLCKSAKCRLNFCILSVGETNRKLGVALKRFLGDT